MRGMKWESREQWLGLSLALLWLLLFFAPVICKAESPSDQPSQPSNLAPESTEPLSNEQISSWQGFDDLLNQLETEASASQRESTELLNELVKSRTGVIELSRLLDISDQCLKDLGQSMANEREQAEKAFAIAMERYVRAEASRDRWKLSALILGPLAIIGWAMVGVLVQ